MPYKPDLLLIKARIKARGSTFKARGSNFENQQGSGSARARRSRARARLGLEKKWARTITNSYALYLTKGLIIYP